MIFWERCSHSVQLRYSARRNELDYELSLLSLHHSGRMEEQKELDSLVEAFD
jgi:hypothetical protein